MPSDHSIFKTPDLEKQYMAVYESVLDLWKVPHEAVDVRTSFGTTHINIAGSKESPAMVLFPGFGANSTQWFPNIAALSSQLRVYAVDTDGQPGKSIPDPDHPLLVSNSSVWITEVLNCLGVEKAHLGGVSLGAWLALRFVIQKPERSERVILLDPAASFERMSNSFLWRSFMPFMVHPTRKGLTKYFRWMTRGYQVNKEWGELMILGILNTRPQPPIRAAAFSDQELQRVRVPVMLLIGERSVIYDPQRVYLRARRLIPNIQAEIIPDASHALIAEKSELVNTHILKFVAIKRGRS
jgi:pimeloyl-ACP methyl ester carboxylesterase